MAMFGFTFEEPLNSFITNIPSENEKKKRIGPKYYVSERITVLLLFFKNRFLSNINTIQTPSLNNIDDPLGF